MRYLKIIVAAGISLAACLPVAAASSLSRDTQGLIPGTVGEIAYIDLKEVRRSPHYAMLRQRVVPARFADFERFVIRVGVNVDTDLDWLTWGLVSEEQTGTGEYFFGIVQGQFSETDIRNYYKVNELPTAEFRNQTIYLYGDKDDREAFAMTLLDTSTGVFGTRASVELVLETRDGLQGDVTRNREMAQSIAEVNGRSPIWVVMDAHYSQLALSQLLPEMTDFNEYQTVAETFRSAAARMAIGRELSLQLEVQCAQASDAQVLAFLIQTGLTAQGWQAQQAAPELVQVLNRADVRNVGDNLRLSLLAREDELRALLQQNIKLFP